MLTKLYLFRLRLTSKSFVLQWVTTYPYVILKIEKFAAATEARLVADIALTGLPTFP